MGLLFLLLPGNGRIVFVIVPLKVSMAVPVIVIFFGQLETSDGILPVLDFIMGTVYMCWLFLIQKETF